MKRVFAIMCIMAFFVMVLGGPVYGASKPSTTSITSLASGTDQTEGGIFVTWKKVSASGYQLQYGLSDNFKGCASITISGAASVTRSLSSLQKGQVYYLRVRAYNKSGSSKVYASWSAVKSIKAHEHEYKARISQDPACQLEGIETYTCSGCGYSFDEYLAALNHKYKGIVSKKATAKQAGIMKYTCSRCGDVYTETIPKLKQSKGTSNSTSKATTKATTKATSKAISKATQPSSSTADSSQITRLQRTRKARQAAVDWAIEIANDNSFHYGRPKWAHKFGCYFCGSNQSAKSSKRKAGASLSECAKTYCCNPFITAAMYHGAGAREVNCKVKSKHINLANDNNKALNNKEAFQRISKPSDIMQLEAGDILLTPTHAMLYAGDGKVVHAAHHDNGKRNSYWNSSIVYEEISSRQWQRTSQIYRYIGTGKF